MADPQTISAEALCALTGLTDRRHRQLAAQGFFPPPIESQYQLTPTVKGILRYYKELHQRRDKTMSEKRAEKLDNENVLLQIQILERQRRLIPVELVQHVWFNYVSDLRQKISCFGISETMKHDLLKDLHDISGDDYFPAPQREPAGDIQDDAEAA